MTGIVACVCLHRYRDQTRSIYRAVSQYHSPAGLLRKKEEWNKDEITAITFKYQDRLFDRSGILRASMGKEKDILWNAGSQGGELASPSGGQEPRRAKMGHSLLSRQISGEGRRAPEYKRLCAPTGKGSILLRLVVICKGNTMMQRVFSQFRKKEGDPTLKRMQVPLSQHNSGGNFEAIMLPQAGLRCLRVP